MTAYYNENNPDCVAWLRELIKQKLIPDGVVDDRSIVDVMPEDLHGFTQKHFFAGVGGWALGCRLAGWPEDRPVDTVSCPCQPLSCAGPQLGELDIRHLWPEYHRIKRQLEPCETFGEQVASPLGIEWCDGISLDLEELGYDVAAFDLPAASVGAPHIRQRLYWVAYANGERRSGFDPLLRQEASGRVGAAEISETAGSGAASGLADAPSGGQRIDRSASREAGHADQCGARRAGHWTERGIIAMIQPAPLPAWEVEINYISCIVFAATKPKARWTAVRSYWDAFGRTPNWPTCIVGRRPHLDGKGDPKRAYAPNYF